MDRSAAYISAVTKDLPHAKTVFDHFHDINLFNDRLSELRRTIQREAEDDHQKHVLKGTGCLLLKDPENLDNIKNEQQYLKEDLLHLWNQPNKEIAEKFLEGWAARAHSSERPILIKFARTLQEHGEGILAFYDYPISTGPLEGTSNKIKTLHKQGYGFRDMEFFKLKIYALQTAKYALIGRTINHWWHLHRTCLTPTGPSQNFTIRTRLLATIQLVVIFLLFLAPFLLCYDGLNYLPCLSNMPALGFHPVGLQLQGHFPYLIHILF